jgi:glycosyltransferase involved in cell wall biosynthesis/predicted O-methyltransferase YrrM
MVKGRVSVIIPGRCEDYFQQTIDSALDRATGDIEVIAVIDGYEPDPPLFARPNVTLIKLDKSIGQRAAYNLGVRESSGQYVMKIDAHALLSPGYDEALKAHCPPRTVIIPEMRRLDVHTWQPKPRGKTHFMYIGLDLYCHYWRQYRKRPAAKAQYPEVMTGQGSCWFTTRQWNDHIGLLDEGVGSWGNVGIEVSLRTWLCGGSQIVNRNVWQAHWFRKDEGGFPYPMNGRNVAKAHRYTFDNYYFKDDAFPNQTRPFHWLIDKFAPVPGWEAYLNDRYEIPRTIIYYTDHHIDEDLARAVRKNLKKVAATIPIISVSQQPLNFGRNICVGPKPRSNRSIYEQILAGLEAAEPESVIYLCEHDVAYSPSHFAHVPEIKERIEYNQNRYYWAPGQTEYLPARGKWPLSQLVAYREYLMQQVQTALQQDEPSSELYRGVRTHRYESERPNVDIRHGKNFSQNGRWKKAYYAGTAPDTVTNIGHWGSPRHMLSKLSWNPQPKMLSDLCRLLREHYGLTRFLPAPIRVKDFHRIDVAKVINLLGLKKGAEIGVAGGQHSELLCQNIEGCELLCVDTWATSWSRKLYRPAQRRLKPYNTTIIRKSSIEAAREVPNASLDFVYIDAAHDFDNVMLDLITWSRKVRAGGIVSGHDYDRAHLKGVVPAVDTYTKVHRIAEWFLTDQKREASFFWLKPEAT